MTFTVTERAAVALRALTRKNEPGPGQVLRLVCNSEGLFKFALDVIKEDDQIIVYQDEAVLVIDPATEEKLVHTALDFQSTSYGPSFLLACQNDREIQPV